MKLRPQVQLRFRDAEQFMDVKTLAGEEKLSVNEWILHQIEQVPLLKGARIVAERAKGGFKGKEAVNPHVSPIKAKEGQPEGAVRGSAAGCIECGALIGHQKWCKARE